MTSDRKTAIKRLITKIKKGRDPELQYRVTVIRNDWYLAHDWCKANIREGDWDAPPIPWNREKVFYFRENKLAMLFALKWS
jgi:hypothetical protein